MYHPIEFNTIQYIEFNVASHPFFALLFIANHPPFNVQSHPLHFNVRSHPGFAFLCKPLTLQCTIPLNSIPYNTRQNQALPTPLPSHPCFANHIHIHTYTHILTHIQKHIYAHTITHIHTSGGHPLLPCLLWCFFLLPALVLCKPIQTLHTYTQSYLPIIGHIHVYTQTQAPLHWLNSIYMLDYSECHDL